MFAKSAYYVRDVRPSVRTYQYWKSFVKFDTADFHENLSRKFGKIEQKYRTLHMKTRVFLIFGSDIYSAIYIYIAKYIYSAIVNR